MRDHQKLTSNPSPKGLTCQHPPRLRGQNFMELEPPAFCAVPVVLKLAIQDIQPYSMFVSWKGRNHTGLHGYRVAYYPIEDPDYPAAAISSAAVMPNVSIDSYLKAERVVIGCLILFRTLLDYEQILGQKRADHTSRQPDTGDSVLGVCFGTGQLDSAKQFAALVRRHTK